MNVKPKFVYYDIRRKQSVSLIMYTHENDVDTQVLEVSMLDNGEPIELSADYTYTAAIVNHDTKALINDNISCELNDSGNVLIPIDNFHTLGAQDLLIELTITDGDGNQVLVTPFPLWIHVNASILDDAQVTPESQGTVPELLEDAEKALEDAQQAIEDAGDYENLENKPQINGHELVGNKTGDDLGLQNKLTAGENITIDENDGIISASGGVTSYSDLTDKPQINGITLSGNKKNSDLGFSNFYYSKSNPPIYTSSAVDYQLNDIWINTNTNTAFRLGYKGNNKLLWYPLRVNVFLSDGAPPQSEIVQSNSLIYNAGDIWISRIYNSGSTRPFYVLTGLYICVGSAKQSQPPLDQYNITWARLDNKVRSGVVNSNGSITFTNSDGTTFTTSGTSVIGADGFSPTATVTQTQNGATVSITDKNGTTTANISNGADGQDYVLTAQDKSDIAAIVLSELPTTQGVLYGNTSN